MRKSISFFILSNTGTRARQFTLSSAAVKLLTLLVIATLACTGYIIHDYQRLKVTVSDTINLELALSNQTEEIASQRKQLQQFAGEINALKAKLLALNEFENKIRIIANIEKTADRDALLGVGGSIPEDIDASIPLTEKHNSLIREMHEKTDQIQTATEKQSNSFGTLINYLEDQINLLASTPAIRPATGWETSGFGYRKSPFTGLREFHKGLDIANQQGTPIIATADGIVSYTGYKGLLGKTLVLDHGHGMMTRFGHAHEILVETGDVVKRGDKIATIGSTGRSTGPHLHYEVLLNGIRVNPDKYILN
ncbi:MAG: Phage tail tape measure protein [Olavius algarvensis Delta 4 endosymbiont]|nr:MAG: Phage tail tape measure protein [Olavius algarvensis Delta 4 endosymbiont]